ncbi:hypothetical protein Droror1_Dr00024442 [Drosera rotundifolia]
MERMKKMGLRGEAAVLWGLGGESGGEQRRRIDLHSSASSPLLPRSTFTTPLLSILHHGLDPASSVFAGRIPFSLSSLLPFALSLLHCVAATPPQSSTFAFEGSSSYAGDAQGERQRPWGCAVKAARYGDGSGLIGMVDWCGSFDWGSMAMEGEQVMVD